MTETCKCGACPSAVNLDAIRARTRPGFQLCEWCGRYTGGALLCEACETLGVWSITGVMNERERADDVPTTAYVVLREGGTLDGVYDGLGASVVGVNGVERGDDVVDRLPILRQEQPPSRVVMWPPTTVGLRREEWA